MFDIKGYVLSSKLEFYLEHNLALIQKKKKVARRVSEAPKEGAIWWGKESTCEKEFDVNVGTTE